MKRWSTIYLWKFHNLTIAISLLLALWFLYGCGTQEDGNADNSNVKSNGPLFIYCGAAIRPPMEEVGTLFEQKYGTKVDFTYAGSGCLLSMLSFAKTGDLYLPGERFYTDQAKKEGYVIKEKTVAYWALAIIVEKGNPKDIKTLNDLARPNIKVGIGEPLSVACGFAAKNLLKRNGLWEKVKPNIVLYSGTSPELCNALKLKAIDATINWDAMGFLIRDKAEIIAIPKEKNTLSEMPLGVLSFSKQKDIAQKFLEFAASNDSKAIFNKYGYRTSEKQYIMPYYSNLSQAETSGL